MPASCVFASSSECSPNPRWNFSTVETACPLLLSWDSLRLPVDIPNPRPLPRVRPKTNPLRCPATKPSIRSDPALSQRFAGFLRGWAVSLLRPTADKRFATFLMNIDQLECPKAVTLDQIAHVPAARFTPLEELSSPAAVPCHHGLCLPDCCLSLHTSTRTSRRSFASMQLARS